MTTGVRVTITTPEGQVLEDVFVSGPVASDSESEAEREIMLARQVREAIESSPDFESVEDN